jgi:hypothetical protein
VSDLAPTPQTDARPISRARLALRVVLMLAVIVFLIQAAMPAWARIADWNLGDNDDAMRILSVRDWLSGQAWFDPRQHRLNPPEGGDIHWSRLADLPVAAIAWPLSGLLGLDLALKVAAFAAPLALQLIYVVLGVRAATAIGGGGAFVPAILFLIAAPAATGYFVPGRVDHHGLQLVFVMGAFAGLVTGRARGAALAGLCVALSIATGLEALPLLAAMIGWVALRWIARGDDARATTLAFCLGLAIGLPSLFALTVPVERWGAPVNDAVGRAHVAAFAAGAALLGLAAWAASGRAGAGIVVRVACAAGIGAALSGVAFAFPELRAHPYAGIDPMLVDLWLKNVVEVAPLAQSRPGRMITFALFPVLGTLIAAIGILMTRAETRERWALALICVAAGAALTLFWQGRMAGQATAVASVAAAAGAALLWARVGPWAGVVCALAVNPIAPAAIGGAVHRAIEPKTQRYASGGGAGCYGVKAFAHLAGEPKGVVLAPLDLGARVLLATHHSAMAAPYHRNNRGNLLSYGTFVKPPEEARVAIADMGATHVALCVRSSENFTLSRRAPNGLMAVLTKGPAPTWLIPVPAPKGSDVRVWRVAGAPSPD